MGAKATKSVAPPHLGIKISVNLKKKVWETETLSCAKVSDVSVTNNHSYVFFYAKCHPEVSLGSNSKDEQKLTL
jgi:hypothetical protein